MPRGSYEPRGILILTTDLTNKFSPKRSTRGGCSRALYHTFENKSSLWLGKESEVLAFALRAKAKIFRLADRERAPVGLRLKCELTLASQV
jgi:hypothetical protein